jgi:signal peptidase I
MRRLGGFLLILLLGTIAAKILLFDFPKVGGNDMAPTLVTGDWLLGYKLDKAPTRGKLILFEHPQLQGRLMIRRVIGLPGEKVVVRREVPSVDGKAAERKTVGEVQLRLAPGEKPATMRLIEERLDHVTYRVLKDPRRRSVDIKPVQLEGAYFVMSDNRNHGTDSRTFGPVPADNLRAVITHRMVAGEDGLVGAGERDNLSRLK